MWEPLEPDLGLERGEALGRKLKAAIALTAIALALLGAFTLDDEASVELAIQPTAGGEK